MLKKINVTVAVGFNTCTDGVVQLQENTPVGRVTQEGIPSPLK